MAPDLAVQSPKIRWASGAAGPLIGLLLVASWALPLEVWAAVVVGVVSTVIFGFVLLVHRQFGRRLLTRPAVLPALVIYSIALFTVAYAIVALSQDGAIQTNGDSRPDSLGVAALLATAMGIAGGEVGVQVRDAARVVAQIQLLVVIGSLAGAGAQAYKGLTGEDPGAPTNPMPSPPMNPVLDLYRRVYERLTRDDGERAWREVGWPDPERKLEVINSISALPDPDTVTDPEARAVFDRIISSDLEFFYGISFYGTTLADAVRPYSRYS